MQTKTRNQTHFIQTNQKLSYFTKQNFYNTHQLCNFGTFSSNNLIIHQHTFSIKYHLLYKQVIVFAHRIIIVLS